MRWLLDRLPLRVSRRDNADRYYVASLGGFALFVHHLHHSEDPDLFHSHPWEAISFILGSYTEERFGQAPRVRRWFNRVSAFHHHRIDLHAGPVWTIFLHGRRCNRWQVIDRAGTVVDVEPWRGVGGRTSYAPDEAAPARGAS